MLKTYIYISTLNGKVNLVVSEKLQVKCLWRNININIYVSLKEETIMKKTCTLFLVMILVLTSLTACGGGGATEEGTETPEVTEKVLTYAFTFSRNVLDPSIDKYYMGLRCGALETLTKIDTDKMEVVPWLAESWSNKDGINWEFVIKSDIQFSDGTPLDAEAVKASIQRLIEANKGLNNALKIASIEADGQTLKIVTTDVHPGLYSELAHPQTAIVQANGTDIETMPIGTGPYVITNFVPNAQIDLSKNANYWDGEPKLDKVVFLMNEDSNSRLLALQAGNADVISHPAPESLETIEADENLIVDSVKGLSRVNDVLYNIKRIDDANVRKGLDALINRQEIVDTIMVGQASVAKGPFVPGYSFAPKYSEHPFGLDIAIDYFGKAGYKIADNKVMNNDGSPVRLKFVIYTAQQTFPPISQMIQSNAQQIGIELEISIVDGIDEYLYSNEDWDMAMYSCFKVPRGDASYYLNTFIIPGAAYGYSRITDENLGRIINEFNVETDIDTRSELALQAAKIIDDENYISYFTVPNIISAYNKRVMGWETNPIEYYMITKDLDVSN